MGDRTCTLEDCARPLYAKGLCRIHYGRKLRHGDPLRTKHQWGINKVPCAAEGCTTKAHAKGLCQKHYIATLGQCSVDGCGRGARARGLCNTHYKRKIGRSEIPVDAPIKPKKSNKGDRIVTPNGYVMVHDGHRFRMEHRVVMAEMLGRPLARHESPHHVNGVRTDNRPENLELWVRPQPAGQRLDQMLDWWVEHYPEALAAALEKRTQLRLIG